MLAENGKSSNGLEVVVEKDELNKYEHQEEHDDGPDEKVDAEDDLEAARQEQCHEPDGARQIPEKMVANPDCNPDEDLGEKCEECTLQQGSTRGWRQFAGSSLTGSRGVQDLPSLTCKSFLNRGQGAAGLIASTSQDGTHGQLLRRGPDGTMEGEGRGSDQKMESGRKLMQTRPKSPKIRTPGPS